MKIRLLVPEVKRLPDGRPRACRYCAKPVLHRHGAVSKPVKDHRDVAHVEVHRYECASCGGTFRHYPADGVTNKDQTQRTVVLAALMYGLGLSCSAISHLLSGRWAAGSARARRGGTPKRPGRP